MHGDKLADEDAAGSDEELWGEGDKDEDAPVQEWEPAGVAQRHPCPTQVPDDLKGGDRIVVWFGAPYLAWQLRVDRRGADAGFPSWQSSMTVRASFLSAAKYAM